MQIFDRRYRSQLDNSLCPILVHGTKWENDLLKEEKQLIAYRSQFFILKEGELYCIFHNNVIKRCMPRKYVRNYIKALVSSPSPTPGEGWGAKKLEADARRKPPSRWRCRKNTKATHERGGNLGTPKRPLGNAAWEHRADRERRGTRERTREHKGCLGAQSRSGTWKQPENATKIGKIIAQGVQANDNEARWQTLVVIGHVGEKTKDG